ncbi:DNA-processing protein DprA [Paratractidigestivibacter sp.]|uniref:DNA-processing protein DprA n=1 Tax=Paratractidigestivibacter sp. TaxID=2847316 RepID=UPI002AC9693A|nr:DNA-processing protein DprA [Paratractidigestivibacter sp.]
MTIDEKCWELRLGEDGYPSRLMDLANPPQVIYGRGDPGRLEGIYLGVVGARRATPYGLAIASMAGRVAAEGGVGVVSGGAMGCDAESQRAALNGGAPTIVVSGVGADCVYPDTSRDVFERAVAEGGAVISAEKWGSPPRRWAFPKRNALIAALCRALVVTEAGYRSGTLSTADAAIELERPVYAIPGSIFSANSRGTNMLISEGAQIIHDEEALSTALALDLGFLVMQTKPKAEADPVMVALLGSALRPEELAQAMGQKVLETMRLLADYEARNLVERQPDGKYSPTKAYYLGNNMGH